MKTAFAFLSGCLFLVGCNGHMAAREDGHPELAWDALNRICVPNLVKGKVAGIGIRNGAERLTGRSSLSLDEKRQVAGLRLQNADAWKYEGSGETFFIAANQTGRSKCAVISMLPGTASGPLIEADKRYYYVAECPVFLPLQRKTAFFRLFRRADDAGMLAASFSLREMSGWIVTRYDDVRSDDETVSRICSGMLKTV